MTSPHFFKRLWREIHVSPKVIEAPSMAVVEMSPEPVVDLSTTEQVVKIHTSPIYLNHPNLYQRHLIPDNILPSANARWSTRRFDLPDVGIYKLRQVYVVNQGLVFTSAGALFAQTKQQHSDAAVKQAREKLLQSLAAQNGLPRHEKAILCKKSGSGNYGHWIAEMLPKAYWARKEAGAEDWPVVVQKTTMEMDLIVEQSLAAIGVTAEQIIQTTDSPVYFEELLVVDGLTAHAVFISPLVMECMDAIAAKAPPAPHQHLYAVRRPARSRDFEDERQAAGIFGEFGYAETECSGMSFLEQVSAFKSARHVVGVMGAALTNIIFCQPGTEVLLFMPASAREFFFWLISEGRKLDYHEVRTEETGETVGSLPWNRQLRIAPQMLQEIFARLHDRRQTPLQAITPFQTKLRLSHERLVASGWTLSFQHNPDVAHPIRLMPDGAISGYRHQNEHLWRFEETLEILGVNREVSWRFERVAGSPDKIHLRACCQIPGMSEFFARLDEV